MAKAASEGWAGTTPTTLAGADLQHLRAARRGRPGPPRSRPTRRSRESGPRGHTQGPSGPRRSRLVGYALDEGVWGHNDYTFASAEPPITVRLVLREFDAETGHGSPQGDATLDGALYGGAVRAQGATETVRETVATVVFEDIPLGDIPRCAGSASGGYLLDRDVHRIRVTADMAQGSSARDRVEPQDSSGEDPQRGDFIVRQGRCRALRARGRRVLELRQNGSHLQGPSSPFTTVPPTPSGTTRTAMGASDVRRVRPSEAVMTIATAYNESLDAGRHDRRPRPFLRHLRDRGDESSPSATPAGAS